MRSGGIFGRLEQKYPRPADVSNGCKILTGLCMFGPFFFDNSGQISFFVEVDVI
jgi:hypothetical protein